MELNFYNIFLAFYLSSVIMLMYRCWLPSFLYFRKWYPDHLMNRWWPIVFIIHFIGFLIGAPLLWGCILNDNLQERFCMKYINTVLEGDK